MKKLILLPLILLALTVACSSDGGEGGPFGDARIVDGVDTVRLDSGEQASVRLYFGRGVERLSRTSVSWAVDDNGIISVRSMGTSASGDSCFAGCVITAGATVGLAHVSATLTELTGDRRRA